MFEHHPDLYGVEPMEIHQLLSQLKTAREEKNIYIIARVTLMLQGRGYDISLTSAECLSILQCLEAARKKRGILGLEAGYELARWILICQYLLPNENIVTTDTDMLMIQEACDSYCAMRILKQVASLVHMGKVLNIPINLNKLPPKKRRYVEKKAATLA